MTWFEVTLRMMLGLIGALAFALFLDGIGASSLAQGTALVLFLSGYYSGLSYIMFVEIKKEIVEEEKEEQDATRSS